MSNNIVRAIPQIQHGDCDGRLLLEACFLVIMGVFRRSRQTGETENLWSELKSNFPPIAFQQLIFLYLSLYIPLKICCKDSRIFVIPP